MRIPFHLLALRDTATPWRQAACAAFGVGLAVLAAIWLHSTWGVLFGAVGGLYASLLDFGGVLRHRLYTQLAGVTLIGSCAVLGGWLGPHHVMLWVVLATLTFGIGWLDGTGVALETIFRLSALILLVYAFLPQIPPGGLPYLGLGLSLGFFAVWLDTLIWPRAIPSDNRGLYRAFHQIMRGHNAGWLHAFGFAATTCAGLWIAILLHFPRPYWVAAVTLFVIRPDGPDSLRRVFQSVFGAFVGVAVAWCIAHYVNNDSLLLACVIVLAFLRPIGLAFNLWAQSATLTALVLVLYDAALGPEWQAASLTLLRIRLYDVLLGSGVALCGTLLFNPASRHHLYQRLRHPATT